MKNLLLLFFLLWTTLAPAQVYVGQVDINKRYVQYVEIWEKPIDNSDRFYALVDYGQVDNSKDDKMGINLIISNMKGARMEFNGIIDVLNYMYRNGWEVLQVKNLDGYESYVLERREGFVLPAGGMSKK
ncbi:MAG: hypothetical protein AAGD05_11670 [Bacteroidota bacterium]